MEEMEVYAHACLSSLQYIALICASIVKVASHRHSNTAETIQHLKDKNQSFEDSYVHIPDREDNWLQWDIREAVYIKIEWTSLNREKQA